MRAWTVDADDIRVAEDFDDALLHHTPEIDSFLNLDRDDKFIVIGTKGFGKTLLLKAKRILYQRDGRAACLPAGNLLDKPIGDKIFTKDALTFFAASSLPWSKLWLTAIAAATLKHLGRADGLRVTAKLTGLMADERLHGVIDHFVRLLDFTPSELQRAAADTDGHLLPRLRAVNSPVAIFIDGVDEYFNKHIESRASLPSVTGPLSSSVWYFAQLGLVEVAYQLRRINHHLKDVIGRLNPGYLERIDRVDIVGYGRAWRGTSSGDRAVTTRALCVLTGASRASADRYGRASTPACARRSKRPCGNGRGKRPPPRSAPAMRCRSCTTIPSCWRRSPVTSWTRCIALPGSPGFASRCTTARSRPDSARSTARTRSPAAKPCSAPPGSSRTWSRARSGSPRNSARSSPSGRPCGGPRWCWGRAARPRST